MPALTKRSLATRLARLEKKLGVDISRDDDIEEEDALKKEVEEKEEQTKSLPFRQHAGCSTGKKPSQPPKKDKFKRRFQL